MYKEKEKWEVGMWGGKLRNLELELLYSKSVAQSTDK